VSFLWLFFGQAKKVTDTLSTPHNKQKKVSIE